MKQGIRALAACTAVALLATIAAPAIAPAMHVAHAAAKASSARAKKKAVKTYQYTGVIVAMDKSSLTVQKGKTKPTTKKFSKYEKMKVTGDLEKGARVTVYYRTQGDEAIAHRVVVKDEDAEKNEG